MVPFFGVNWLGCSVAAMSTSDGITSLASESTVRVTSRRASKFAPRNGVTVATRKIGSLTADRAAAVSSCRRCTVTDACAGSESVKFSRSFCRVDTSSEAVFRWSYAS